MSVIDNLRSTVGSVRVFGVCSFAVVCVAIVLLPAALPGHELVAVHGHSMGKAIPNRSLVLASSTPATSLRNGDVIVFDPSWADEMGAEIRVVHRLRAVVDTEDGLLGVTAGDANSEADPAPLLLQGDFARVDAVIPFAGLLFSPLVFQTLSFAVAFATTCLICHSLWAGRRIPRSAGYAP